MILMKQRRILSRQQGFSLIEMLLAMALGLIVVTGIVQLFIGNSQSARVISGQARLQENARFAFEFISRAARQAGYFGCIRDPQTRVWGLNGLPNQLPEYNIDQPMGGFNANGGGTWAPAVVNLPGVAGSYSRIFSDETVSLLHVAQGGQDLRQIGFGRVMAWTGDGGGTGVDTADDGSDGGGDGLDDGDGAATAGALPPGFGFDADEGACACRSTGSPSLAWAWVPLLVCRRRRRGSQRGEGGR